MNALAHSLLSLTLALGAQPAAQLQQRDPGPPPAPGLWWGDFDEDELEDVFVITPAGAGRLLRNVGDGAFEEVTEQAGLGRIAGARLALWKDFDADGRLVPVHGPSGMIAGVGSPRSDATETCSR